MKVCHLCGESYTDSVDFCFRDGEVLDQAGTGAHEGDVTEVRAQGTQIEMTTVPVKRSRAATEASLRIPTVTPTEANIAAPAAQLAPPAGTGASTASAVTEPMTHPSASAAAETAADPGMMTPVKGGRVSASLPSEVPTPELADARAVSPVPRANHSAEAESKDRSTRLVAIGLVVSILALLVAVVGGMLVAFLTQRTDRDDAATAQVESVPIERPPALEPQVPVDQPRWDEEEVAPETLPLDVVLEEAPPEPDEPEDAAPPVVDVTPFDDVVSAEPAPSVAAVQAAPVPAPEPVPALVDVVVRSEPDGAMVYVDGRMLDEETPARTRILPGQYTLRVELDDHEAWESTVALGSEPVPIIKLRRTQPQATGAPSTIPKVMVFAPGYDHATTRVMMDEQEVIEPPANFLDVAPGVHRFTLLTLSGEVSVERTVQGAKLFLSRLTPGGEAFVVNDDGQRVAGSPPPPEAAAP